MGLRNTDLEWLRHFEGYHYAVDNSGRYADTLKLARSHVSSNSRIIDLGMYPGHLSLLLKRDLDPDIIGLSYAHPRSFETQMRTQGIDVREFDIAKGRPPFADGSFDVVLCTEIIEHLDRPLQLLVSANQILKPGGILILSTPNHASLKNRINMLSGRPTNQHLFGVEHVFQMNEWVHKREYTLGELKRMLSILGFAVEEAAFTELEHPPDSLRTRVTCLLKKVLYVRQSLKGGIILAARKVSDASYTSIVPNRLRAALSPSAETVASKAGEEVEMSVTIENTGDSIWMREAAGGCGFVQLGAHLRDGGDKLIDYDYLRCPLPEDIPPGKRFALRAGFIAPDKPGQYTVEFDMVNEGISWFKDYRSETTEIVLDVTS